MERCGVLRIRDARARGVIGELRKILEFTAPSGPTISITCFGAGWPATTTATTRISPARRTSSRARSGQGWLFAGQHSAHSNAALRVTTSLMMPMDRSVVCRTTTDHWQLGHRRSAADHAIYVAAWRCRPGTADTATTVQASWGNKRAIQPVQTHQLNPRLQSLTRMWGFRIFRVLRDAAARASWILSTKFPSQQARLERSG